MQSSEFHSGAFPKGLRALGLGLIGALTLIAPGVATANGAGGNENGRLLVQPRAGLPHTELEKILAPHGAKAIGKIRGLDVHVVALPAGASEEAVARRLAHHPHLKFAEPDRLLAPQLIANDVYYASEWQLQTMQAPAAWDLSQGTGVTVAVLDTGVDATHPDLQGQLVPGWNFYDNNANTADVYGHGTLVAGTVAAVSNNAAGVTSIAWNARLMPIRISDVNGYASWSRVASGLTWAADHGAKVANISYMVQGSATVQSAAQYFRSRGGVVVNSAGNTGVYSATAASDSLLSVSATDPGDNRTSWSTYGPYVDLAAPGVSIWSTAAGGGYAAVSGTSFSSPLTAGVVALMIAANPALPPATIVNLLQATAADLGTPGYDQYYGHGRVNAAGAVQAAAQTGSADMQAPTVAISSPGGGSVGGIVSVNIAAADNVGVTNVALLVNGTVVASDATTPYLFGWDSSQWPEGASTLTARAFDAAGNVATSSPVVVTVANATVPPVSDTTPPAVMIASPVDGARVAGQVTIKASATDDVAVASVSVAIDGVVVATGNASSVSYRWNTRKTQTGAHTISAVARDTAGNQTTTSVHVIR